MSDKRIITAKNISIRFAGHQVLDKATFEIDDDEIVTLIGPNGSGKTTLLRIVLGLLKPASGEVYLRPGIRIAYMPQKLFLDNTMPITVERFLRLAVKNGNKSALVEQVLSEVKADSVINAPLQSISGGELQRVLLARCMLRKPEFLVLDEPVQGVDINGQEELYALIKSIRDKFQCGILMVSHNLHLVMAATDRVICLNRHICCTGNPESIQQHPEFIKLFGTSLDNLAVYTHHHDHEHDVHGNVIHNSEHRHD